MALNASSTDPDRRRGSYGVRGVGQNVNPYHPPRIGNSHCPDKDASRTRWWGFLAAAIAMASLCGVLFLIVTTWDDPWVSPIEDAVMAILPRWEWPRLYTAGILIVIGVTASICGLAVGSKAERLLCLCPFLLLGPCLVWYLAIFIFGPLVVFLRRTL